MLILAIDTALEACAVALLDTEANSLRAHESQAMARGHAEALMPMIDRVMKAAELPFTALDRIAVTVGPGSFTGLRVGISAARGLGLAAEKPVVGVTTLSALRRTLPLRVRRTDHLADRCAPRSRLHAGRRRRRRGAGPPARRADGGCLRACAVRRAAPRRQRRAPRRRSLARRHWPRRRASSSRPRPTSPGWRGSASRPIRRRRSRGRSICARSDAKPQGFRTAGAVGLRMIGWLSRLFAPATTSIEPATMRDAAKLSQLHRASFHRGWGESEFETMLAERNTFTQRLMLGRTTDRLHHFPPGGGRGGNSLGRCRARRSAAAAIRAICLRTISVISRDAVSGACFSKWKRTTSLRCAFISAPAFRPSGAGNSIIAMRAAPN